LKIADRDDGLAPPAAGDRGGGETDSADLRKLRRRNKLIEQENEILSCAGRQPTSPATSSQ
jgi:transposase